MFDSLLLRCLVPVTQMSTVREIQPHQPFVRSHECLINLQVGRAATQALYVDTPPLLVQTECDERPRLTGELDGVDVLITPIISCTRIAFGVLVRHGRAESVEYCTRCKILGSDEDNGFALTLDFFFLHLVSMRTNVQKGPVDTIMAAISGSVSTKDFSRSCSPLDWCIAVDELDTHLDGTLRGLR